MLKRVELGKVFGTSRTLTVMIRQDESAKHIGRGQFLADEEREITAGIPGGQGRFARLWRNRQAGPDAAGACNRAQAKDLIAGKGAERALRSVKKSG